MQFIRMSLALLSVGAVTGLVCFVAPASAQPDTENGRYALSPIPGGVLRLDTRSGAVATCTDSGAGWACHATPDERAALDAEIGRLQADNERLRAQNAQRDPAAAPDKTNEALPKSDPLTPSLPRTADGSRKLEIPLPSDQDVDRAMGFLERVWQRLVEMVARVQRDASGKI